MQYGREVKVIIDIYIYADVMFAINYLFDLIILFAVSVMARLGFNILRISAASAVLALYAVLTVYPRLEMLYSVAGRIIISALAGLILSSKPTLRGTIKITALIWGVSAIVGGAVYASTLLKSDSAYFFLAALNGGIYGNASLGTILGGTALAYAFMLMYRHICIRNFGRDRVLFPARLYISGKAFDITVLADTGCELAVPLTGEGILLVQESCLERAAPAVITEIPIKTANGTGKIPIFYPDKAVCGKGFEFVGDIAVGTVKNDFAADGLYTAIINPDAVRKVKEIKNNRSDLNDKKNKNRAFAGFAEAGGLKRQGRVLCGRKRRPAAAPEPCGGGNGIEKAEQSRRKRECTQNFDRA